MSFLKKILQKIHNFNSNERIFNYKKAKSDNIFKKKAGYIDQQGNYIDEDVEGEDDNVGVGTMGLPNQQNQYVSPISHLMNDYIDKTSSTLDFSYVPNYLRNALQDENEKQYFELLVRKRLQGNLADNYLNKFFGRTSPAQQIKPVQQVDPKLDYKQRQEEEADFLYKTYLENDSDKKFERLREILSNKGIPQNLLDETSSKALFNIRELAYPKYLEDFFKKNRQLDIVRPSYEDVQEQKKQGDKKIYLQMLEQRSSALKSLILNIIKEENPVIEEWISSKCLLDKCYSLSYDVPVGEDGGGVGNRGLSNDRQEHLQDVRRNFDFVNNKKNDLEKMVSSFVKFYLGEQFYKFSQKIKEVMSQKINSAINTGDINSYNKLEKLNTYINLLIEQFDNIVNNPDVTMEMQRKGTITYKSKNGDLNIPYDYVKKLYESVGVDNIENLSAEELYKKSMEIKSNDIDVPPFFTKESQKGFITSTGLYEPTLKMAELKMAIRDEYNSGNIDPQNIIKTFSEQEGAENYNLLKYFSNVNSMEASPQDTQKMINFIKGTILQLKDTRHVGKFETARKSGRQIPKESFINSRYFDFYQKSKNPEKWDYENKGEGYNKLNLRADPQFYFLDILPDLIEMKKSGEFSPDTFKLFEGMVKPHAKVQDLKTKEYEYLFGKSDREVSPSSFNAKIEDVTKNITNQYNILMKEYTPTLKLYKDKKRRKKELEKMLEEKVEVYNKKLENNVAKKNEILEKRGLPAQTMEQAIGIEEWSRTKRLPDSIYLNFNMSLAPKVLFEIENKIRLLDDGFVDVIESVNKFNEENPSDKKRIGSKYLGIEDLKKRIESIKEQIEKLLEQNNITPEQAKEAQIAYNKYWTKKYALNKMYSKSIMFKTACVQNVKNLMEKSDREIYRTLYNIFKK